MTVKHTSLWVCLDNHLTDEICTTEHLRQDAPKGYGLVIIDACE